MHAIYYSIVYRPLYNALVFLIGFLPSWANAGIAIILLTVIVRLILLPLAKASIRTQMKMKELEPKMKEIKEKYQGQEQSVHIMNLYKEAKLNPFSGFLLLLIQFPIIIALYSIFARGGLPMIHADLLYSFVHAPGSVDMHFLGINLISKNLILALIVAVTQYFQLSLTLPKPPPKSAALPDAKPDMMQSMHAMRFIFPVLIFIIAYPFFPFSKFFPQLPSALVLYWIVSNLFMIGQEIFIRRRMIRKNS